MADSPAEVISGALTRLGRYFSLVSLLPASLLCVSVFLIKESRAWAGRPKIADALQSLESWPAPKLGTLIVVSFVVALFLHPLQFATTQLLEGYWGPSRVAIRGAEIKIRAHRRRHRRLADEADARSVSWRNVCDTAFRDRYYVSGLPADDPSTWSAELRKENDAALLDSQAGDRAIADYVAEQQLLRYLSSYPVDGRRIMPTRLGNVLRRMEESAGTQYGLRAIGVAPHLSQVSDAASLGYLDDARQEMDTSIRLCLTSAILTLLVASATLTDGWWLLLTLAPYALGRIAYSGCIAAATEFGSAYTTMLDLNRFALYERLRLQKPTDTQTERLANKGLMALLDGDRTVVLPYQI